MSDFRRWWRLDVLGVLTVLVYGTWFYGFGVLFKDLGAAHGVSAGTLGITYGAANLLAGIGTLATGRRLDTFGPGAVLGFVGPLGAVLYVASANFVGTGFLVLYACGGGLMGAAGFYSFTQPLAVRVSGAEPARSITRLTIWGALSSPIMIPLTEALRSQFGWQVAVRVPGILTAAAFAVCAVIAQPRIAATAVSRSLWVALMVAVRTPHIRRFATSAFLAGIAASTLLVYQLPTMIWAGATAGVAAGLASGRGLLQLAGRLPLVSAIQRWGAPRLMLTARSLVGAAAIVLMWSGSLWVGIVYVAIAGIAIGALSALDGIVARTVIGDENLGTVMAGVGLVATLGGSFGPVIGGVLRDQFDTPAATMALVVAAAWLSVLVLASLRLQRESIPD